MNAEQIARYTALIKDLIRQVSEEDDRGRDGRAVVTLDQQSVGRLSRMDALQHQAMAQAQQARRNQQKSRLQAALNRIAEGEFGYCIDCGDDIAPDRLDIDPAATICINCAKG